MSLPSPRHQKAARPAFQAHQDVHELGKFEAVGSNPTVGSDASLVLAVERLLEAQRVGSSNLSGSTVTEAELVEAPGREPGGSGFKSHQSP